MGCEVCKKRLWNYGGNYYCAPCKCSTAIPLYKFQLCAPDDTAEARFFCHDVVARQIIRRNCDSLRRSINNVPGLPDQILRAVVRSYTFTVGLTDQSYRSMQDRVYLVGSCVFRPQPQIPRPPAPLVVHAPSQAILKEQGSGSDSSAAHGASTSGATTLCAPGVETASGNIAQAHAPALGLLADHTAAAVKMYEVIDVQGSHPVVQSASGTPPPEPSLEQTPPIEKSHVPAGKHDTPAVSAGARKRLAYDSSSSEEEEGADDHDHHTMDADAEKLKLANTSDTSTRVKTRARAQAGTKKFSRQA